MLQPRDDHTPRFARKSLSRQVNGRKLRELRMALGWTQEELAARSGYSTRLIRKAESCQALRRRTIIDLAETLSMGGLPVSDSDLVHDSPAIFKSLYEGLFSDDPAELMPDSGQLRSLITEVAGHAGILPLAGRYAGLEGFLELRARFRNMFDAPEPTVPDPRWVTSDDHVACLGQVCHRQSGNGNAAAVWFVFFGFHPDRIWIGLSPGPPPGILDSAN